MNSKSKYTYPIITLVVMAFFLILSVIDYQDTFITWVLESIPVTISLILLPCTMKRFRLTNLLYTLIMIHSIILVYGAHYSYSEVPLGFWMSSIFGWTRNNYDKIGHFMQGFCPVMVAREIVSRKTPLKRGGWLAVLCCCVAMTISALYEIFEMIVSIVLHGDGKAFLGLQGYIWDTQTDMLFCLIGATVALILLTHLHNKQLDELEEEDKKNKASTQEEVGEEDIVPSQEELV